MPQEQQKLAKDVLKKYSLLRKGWFPTFRELTNEVGMTQWRDVLRTLGATASSLAAFFEMLYGLVITENSGSARFKLTPELITLLRDTDLPTDVMGYWLRLPFEGVVLEVPAGTFGKPADDITELYLTRVEADGRFRCIFSSDREQNTNYISMPLDEEKSIGQLVEDTKARAFENIPAEDAAEIKSQWAYKDYFASDVFTLAINAALYITSAGADVQLDDWPIKTASGRWAEAKLNGVTSRRRLESLEKNIEEAKAHPIYIVGGGLKFGAEDIDGAALTAEGRKMMRKHQVRGHWRNQPHGEKNAERKLIWLKPHWRGMSYAEMLERNYIVK